MTACLTKFHLGIVASVAVSLLSGTALAADYTLENRIGAVTVFPRGAEVERRAALDLPAGSHRLIFDHLPDGIGANDVRAEGASNGGLVIQSVDVARVPLSGDPAERDSLRREREDLGDRKAVLEGSIRTAELQRQMIASLVRPPQPVKEGEAAVPALSPDALFAFIAERHDEIEARVHAARQQIRDIDRRMDEIDRLLSRQGEETRWESRVTVSVSSENPGQGELKLRYQLANAGWQPVYDARLDTSAEADNLSLTQRAAVRQRTGEDWSGVDLMLATTQPRGDTAAPEPQVSYIGFARPLPRKASRDMGLLMGGRDEAMAPSIAPLEEDARQRAAAPAPIAEREAAVADLGFDAIYHVPGTADIPATGDSRLVLIGNQDITSRMEARIVPAARDAAFLTVRFANAQAAPLPPGVVRLFRDGVFIGEGRMPLATHGEETELGFGLDERIAVTRTMTARQRGEEGIFNRARTDTNAWRTQIANHHKVAVDVVVLESLPQALDEDITVTPLATNDKPDETDVDGKPGVQAWRFTLAPQGERVLSFGYRIDWPQGREVVLGMR
ncbi:MAG: DUF4139 domain-containing protein [Rhodobiaceae bacterium]|nr:DUF4139 domain-containing protein [Rhodobiaceae bacterium]